MARRGAGYAGTLCNESLSLRLMVEQVISSDVYYDIGARLRLYV